MATIGTAQRPAYIYDAESDTWIPIGVGPHSHPNYIDALMITAKGEVLVGTGSSVVGKLDAGMDGQVLVASSTADAGIVWQTLNALPTQSGNTGKFLTTDGTNASWSSITVDPTPQLFLLMGA